MRRITALLLFLSASGFLGAQDPWGPLVGPVVPEGDFQVLEFHQLAALGLPGDSPYLLGLEVEIQVPRELVPHRGSCVILLYQGEKSPAGQGLVRSRRLVSEVLPPVGKFYLQLPLTGSSGLKSGFDKAVLPAPLRRQDGDVYLSILPIDKGFSSETAGIPPFQIKTRPLIKNLGGIAFSFRGLAPGQISQLSVRNGQTALDPKGVNFLTPGLYNLEVTGPSFRSQTLRIAVAQGKTENLEVVMVESKALLRLEVPSGTKVTIDGQGITDPSELQTVELGERTVRFQLGDYTLTKTLNLTRPGTYRVSLFMEIQVNEEL